MIDPSLMRSCDMVKCHAFFTMIVYVNSVKSKKDLEVIRKLIKDDFRLVCVIVMVIWNLIQNVQSYKEYFYKQ